MQDYIIVGGGSAGCVLANRLSADPSNRVLLLEAGGPDYRNDIFSIPASYSRPFRTAHDWAFQTEAQKHLHNRALYWPRGKVLGGSSSINAMIYIRGNRLDYDTWRDLGNPGWGFDDVLPYFKKAEHNERGESAHHGAGGPLNVADLRSPHPYTLRFLESCRSLGIPANEDFNGTEQDGCGLYQVTQKDGRRCSTAVAYLAPAMDRPNLAVKTHAPVSRVLFEGQQAIGVAYRQCGEEREARAEAEVILCGGAVSSPQLLLLSGVGPAGHLREQGVDVVADLPGMGENLQDHLAVPLLTLTRKGASLLQAERPWHLLQFYLRKRGWLTSNVGEGGAFVRTRPGLDAPDLQFHFVPAAVEDHGLSEPAGHGYTFVPTLVSVASRGWIGLRSTNPDWAPRIEPNYLEADEDLEVLLAGCELSRQLADQAALVPYRDREYLPGPEVRTPEQLRDYVRAHAGTLYHPAGTCKMGVDDLSVVDPQLRVREVDGLRVVDASIMPTVIRGNTNAPTIMIAEKAADIILSGRPQVTKAASA
ncbi:MAG: choline dehydrogenase [Nitriliruptorales bacterium]|nr:choline dehydrogenase [Nitriliruptorales bacterium]